jgi:hypothetical protein
MQADTLAPADAAMAGLQPLRAVAHAASDAGMQALAAAVAAAFSPAGIGGAPVCGTGSGEPIAMAFCSWTWHGRQWWHRARPLRPTG